MSDKHQELHQGCVIKDLERQVAELISDVAQLTKELMLVEAERDALLEELELEKEYSSRMSWELSPGQGCF